MAATAGWGEDRDHLAGERHLRLLVEARLDQGAASPHAELARVAAALTAVDRLHPATAARVLADAALAWKVRSHERLDADDLAEPGPPAEFRSGFGPGASRWVATGSAPLETPSGPVRVEVVSGGGDGAAVVVGGVRPSAPAYRARPGHHGGVRPGTARPGRPGPRPAGGALEGRAAGSGAGGLERLVLRTPDGTVVRPRRDPVAHAGRVWVALDAPDGPVPPWVELTVADGPATRLDVTPAAPTVLGRPHGRSPGASWLLGALLAAVCGDRAVAGSLASAVAALQAIGAVERSDPLARQALLLDAVAAGDAGPDDLEARFGSALAAATAPSPLRRVLPVATLVDLGVATARLDAVVDDDGGARLLGRFSPWGPVAQHRWAVWAFDDRGGHHGAEVAAATPDPTGADVAWRLSPGLAPDARLLRLTVADWTSEAAVEVTLP